MQHISLSQLQELQQSNTDILLIDVREQQEHEMFNIGGTLISLGDITRFSHTIPKDIPVIVYCRKGVRSQIAIQRLEEKLGFNNLINLRGGIGDGHK